MTLFSSNPSEASQLTLSKCWSSQGLLGERPHMFTCISSARCRSHRAPGMKASFLFLTHTEHVPHLRLSVLAVLPIGNILSLNIQRLVSSLPGNYRLNAIVSLRLSLTFLFNSNYPTGRNVLAPPACFIFLPSCVLLSVTCLIIPCGILGVFSFSLH